MKVQYTSTLALAIAMALTITTPAFAKDKATKSAKPKIEVCFVLDTTGSMSGLIEGAKQKIWSVANKIASAKPTPDIRFGLIGYRDRGDEYVVKTFNLTNDLDSVYSQLQSFRADGGGDTPESVNEALDEAVNKLSWSADRSVLKIIFLVGDSPPHMDYLNAPKYPDVCQAAVKKDLVINTIQCGNLTETTPIWQEIAKLSEGSYAAIPQSGNMIRPRLNLLGAPAQLPIVANFSPFPSHWIPLVPIEKWERKNALNPLFARVSTVFKVGARGGN